VGIQLDLEHAQKLVEHGPPAEDAEGCERFREFWGEKAELRRFNDGRIVESVVWELTGKATNERFQIPGRIVRYIVGRHFQIPSEDVTILDEAYDDLLIRPADVVVRYSALAKNPTPEATQRLALTTFDALVQDIKVMENLPLSLVNAIPVDEGIRYTSPLVNLPVASKTFGFLPDSLKYIPLMDVILEFEKSNRWPDDLAAIQKVKIAFLEAVAQGLLQKSAVHAVIAWDTQNCPTLDHVALEVLLESGFAFRLRVHHDREQALLERIISDKRQSSDYERKKAQIALDHHVRVFTVSPRHHAAILALQRRFPSYSHTTRLFKRWLAAHWLSPHVSTEAAELLCAEVYLNPGAQEYPSSGQTGFARCITLLARWDFRDEPLVVPLYTAADVLASSSASTSSSSRQTVTFPAESLSKALDEFAGHLAVDPSLSRGAWTIVTEADLSGRFWSEKVTAIIANRACDLARATSAYLQKCVASSVIDIKVSCNSDSLYAH
jgi:U3 small nucleolar RNA-associated protein 22